MAIDPTKATTFADAFDDLLVTSALPDLVTLRDLLVHYATACDAQARTLRGGRDSTEERDACCNAVRTAMGL